MVLLGFCDSNYCFTELDIGDYGKNSDSSIFKKLIKNELNIPGNSILPSTSGPNLPYVISTYYASICREKFNDKEKCI